MPLNRTLKNGDDGKFHVTYKYNLRERGGGNHYEHIFKAQNERWGKAKI